ncbi:MAG: LamG domain-containing protein [Acidobacteriaceae bacterium]
MRRYVSVTLTTSLLRPSAARRAFLASTVAAVALMGSLPAHADFVASVDATTPLAFFPLQTANGSSTVNGYTSTDENGAAIAASNGGPQANAISLNGVNNGTPQYVATSLSGGINGSGSTMAWVNLASLNGGATEYIAGESQNGNDFDLQFTGNSSTLENLCFYSDSGSSTCAALSVSDLLNKWNMVTATYNSTTGEQDVYLDGTLVATNDDGAAGSKNSQFTIGYSTVFSDRDLNGLISDVAVWNYQLSPSQVAGIYDSSTATPTGLPEPGSLSIFGAGILALGWAWRRNWTRGKPTASV